MKIIVPLDEQAGRQSRVSEHFGSAPFYALANTEAGSIEIIPNTSMHHDHGQCTPADLFSGSGIEAVLCNGIGGRAAARLQMMGIAVYLAEPAVTVEDALALFSSGSLAKICMEHLCHGHDCHH
jgi:predicted Fe-Mo cluster-binding NifX family protein